MQVMAGSSKQRYVDAVFDLIDTTVLQLFIILLLVILMVPTASHAQALLPSGTVLADTPLPTFSKDVQEVSLVLTVTNKRGHFVRDLNPKDLAILDNDLPPEKITFFQSETDLPLRVALVIDTSDSVTNRFKFEQQAAAAFLKKILRPQSDMGLIVGFNQHVRVTQGPSNDPAKLRAGLDQLKLGGETSVFDAVHV